MAQKIQYDPEYNGLSYGVWLCPICKASFYAGGKALHERDCPEVPNGYSNCIYIIGPKVVEHAKEWASTHGADSRVPNENYSYNDFSRAVEEYVPGPRLIEL